MRFYVEEDNDVFIGRCSAFPYLQSEEDTQSEALDEIQSLVEMELERDDWEFGRTIIEGTLDDE